MSVADTMSHRKPQGAETRGEVQRVSLYSMHSFEDISHSSLVYSMYHIVYKAVQEMQPVLAAQVVQTNRVPFLLNTKRLYFCSSLISRICFLAHF